MLLTFDFIKKLCPTSKDAIVEGVVKHFNEYAAKFQITTPLRIAHFLAQAAHESAHFRTLEEYATGDAYDTRVDLGNTPEKDGDGRLYKGRGIFQLTGKANYRTFGGTMLVNNPELAATPLISVITAFEYWKKHDLNALADKDNIELITLRINGGKNGLEDRKKYLASAKKLLMI